jgi:hypothetical protein
LKRGPAGPAGPAGPFFYGRSLEAFFSGRRGDPGLFADFFFTFFYILEFFVFVF